MLVWTFFQHGGQDARSSMRGHNNFKGSDSRERSALFYNNSVVWTEGFLLGVIDLTDYSRLPDGLVFMFAYFSFTRATKVMFPLFLHEFVCC